MEVQTYPSRLYDTLQCTTCGVELDRLLLHAHICPRSSENVRTDNYYKLSTRVEQLSPVSSHHSSNHHRALQPTLPIISDFSDSTDGHCSPPVEYSPSISRSESLSYSTAPSSQRPSPAPSPPKETLDNPLSPPSPKLTNIDCAFPPFPSANRRKKSGKRVTHTRTGTNTSGKSSSYGSKSTISFSTTSVSSMRLFPKSATPDGRSLSSTSLSSRQPSVSSTYSARKPSFGNLAPLPEHTNIIDSSHTAPQAQRIPSNPYQQSEGLDLRRGNSVDDKSLAPARTSPPRDRAFEKSSTLALRNVPTSSEDLSKNPTETSKEAHYKARKPPPIITTNLSSSGPVLQSATSGVSQNGNSTGTSKIGMTFARLFGRQPSQPKNREMVHEALSTSPDTVPEVNFYSSLKAPQSAGSDMLLSDLGSPSIGTPSPMPVTPSHVEALRALEGKPALPAGVEADDSNFDGNRAAYRPELERSQTYNTFEYGSFERSLSPIQEIKHFKSTPDLRTVSTDSASSYGSIGFTNRSCSSRRSDPPLDEVTRKLSDQAYLELLAPPAGNRDTADYLNGLGLLDGRRRPSSKSPRPPHCRLPSQEWNHAPSPKPTNTRDYTGNRGTCRACSQSILPGQKSVKSADGRLSGRYHKACFVCQVCYVPFPTAEFYVHEDKPYCCQHYHELENSLCATCGEGIEGQYVETANTSGTGLEKHHPTCLKCATCQIQLNQDYFEWNGRGYCERDAYRMAGLGRLHENVPLRPSPLVQEYLTSPDQPFPSNTAFPERRTTRLMMNDERKNFI